MRRSTGIASAIESRISTSRTIMEKAGTLSVDGIAPTHFLRAVREDPQQRNLLFAGTEFGIYVSFDGGDHWQSLQQNLPVTSVRDMTIHGSDLIVATHGRSFWILDDIAPLRQAAAVNATKPYLYTPPVTVRVDNDAFLGTPLPPEEPQANNPPDGAIVDYYLGSDASKVTLQVLDDKGHVLRHFSSADKPDHQAPAASDCGAMVSRTANANDQFGRASIYLGSLFRRLWHGRGRRRYRRFEHSARTSRTARDLHPSSDCRWDFDGAARASNDGPAQSGDDRKYLISNSHSADPSIVRRSPAAKPWRSWRVSKLS